MGRILETFGALLLILAIWFLVDYSSWTRAMASAHHYLLARTLHQEVTAPYQQEIDGNQYLLIPLK